MSILGSMRSGVSGLAAQSNAFSAISDNISNISTVGYKGTNTAFKTLVTKQTTTSAYSSGGVQSVSAQEVSTQGLLSSSSSSTDLAISGNGYFVVNQAANPTGSDTWAYTRAGSFSKDTNGYLVNSGGYYAQAWGLLPWDGAPEASVINIQGINYMKAYYDTNGQVVYINDNIIDSNNLKPINLATIGGTAAQTSQLSMGANLPASDTIGASQKLSALVYDSLGNSSNLSISFNKQGSNHWGMNISIPSGAACLTLTNSTNENCVYAAAGQLEFSSIPTNGSKIVVKDAIQGQEITFEFVETLQPSTATHIYVSTDVSSVSEFVKNLTAAMKEVLPSGDRFSANNNAVKITQSIVGGALDIDASGTQACVQSSANVSETTGLPSGMFTIQEIDKGSKNGASLTFLAEKTVDDYAGTIFTIGGKKFKFTKTPEAEGDGDTSPYIINVKDAADASDNVIPSKVVDMLYKKIATYLPNIECYSASGNTLEIKPTTTSEDIYMDLTSLSSLAVGEIRTDTSDSWGDITTQSGKITSSFTAYGEKQLGSQVAAILFNSDGTPKEFGVDGLNIEWANGAKNMSYSDGSNVKIVMGNVGTSDGFTQLSGSFSTFYIKQDGAKFGNYSGVDIDENGVITAVFDNGETRPIAVLPLATFSNPNGMAALTGNVWIASDASGDPMLRQAGSNGAGSITSYSLEDSTVDLANELSNMVVVQRAYSASTKIITTADEMLDELTRMV